MVGIFRPPDIVVGGLIFYHWFFLSSFFSLNPTHTVTLLFSSATLWALSSLNGTQRKSVTCSEVSAIWKCMSEIWSRPIPSPCKLGAQNDLCRGFRNLTATLAAYIFRKKHNIHQRASALQIARVSYVVSKRHELWCTNGFKLEVSFHPPFVNSAFHFIARLCRRRSANRSQPNFAKRWAVGRANNLPYRNWGRCSLNNWGPENFTFFVIYNFKT